MYVNRRTIRTVQYILVVMLACGLAGSAYGFAGGTGEPNDPYQIATAEDLLSIGSDGDLLTKHYVLIEDLDLDPNLPGGRVFEDALIAPDGYEGVSGHNGSPFTGALDGQGHTIRNLNISGRHGYDAGLFGKFSGLVNDLHLRDVRISGSPAGAVAGFCDAQGVVLRCSVTGRIDGSEDTGGMVGSAWDGALIDCRAEVEVTGGAHVGGMVGGGPGALLTRCRVRGDIRGDSCVGGLIGELRQGQIVDSGAAGTVTGRDCVGGLVGSMAMAASLTGSRSECDVTAEQTAGGLAGEASFFAGRGQLILDCYARGAVAGSVAGGLIGTGSSVRVVNCYAACAMIPMASDAESAVLGGIFGNADAKRPPLLAGSFWDAEVAGVALTSGAGTQYPGTGFPTGQMQQESAFEQAGWDFRYTWALPEGGYPVLQWDLADN